MVVHGKFRITCFIKRNVMSLKLIDISTNEVRNKLETTFDNSKELFDNYYSYIRYINECGSQLLN